MDAGLLILGVVLLAATAALLSATLGVGGRAEFVGAALLLGGAIVVADSVGLSLVHLLTRPAELAAGALWLLVALVVWRRHGRPRPPSVRPPPPRELVRRAREEPLLALLVVVLALALGLQAFVAVAVAPNESDSLSYHLPRAAYWVQNHTALQYAPGSRDDPTQSHPANSELLVAWTMALTRGDAYAQLVQWAAMIGVIAMIFAAARIVGLSRAEAGFAATVFALLPIPLVQAATTQNDLLLSFLLLAALVFAVTGLRDRARGALLLAAVAAGLAVGTKLDFVFIAPAALLIVAAAIRRLRSPRHLVLFGLAATVFAVLVLGSFVYVQNEIHTHSLTGFSGTPNGDFIKASPLTDAARTTWNMVEAPGLPVPDWISDPAETVVEHLFKGLHGSYFGAPNPAITDYASADTSSYGLVGLLILLPLIAVSITSPRARGWQRPLALGAFGYFAAYSLALGYNPESGRYLLPAAALAAPLFGLLLRRRILALVTVVLLGATLPGTLLHETYKPVLASSDTPSILSLDRLGQLTIDENALVVPLRRLATLVPPQADLGFVAQDNLTEYFLFGRPFRRLFPLDPRQVTPQLLRARHLRYVFIAFAGNPPCALSACLSPRAGLSFTPLGGTAYLVTIR